MESVFDHSWFPTCQHCATFLMPMRFFPQCIASYCSIDCISVVFDSILEKPVSHRKLFGDLFSFPLCQIYLDQPYFVGLISSTPSCGSLDCIGFTGGGMKQSAFHDQLSFHRKASSKLDMVLIMRRQMQILQQFSSPHDKYKYCDGSHHAKPNLLIANDC